MAISFAGGTDRIQYGAYGSSATQGCWSFWMRTTQTTANAALGVMWDSGSRNGFGVITNSTASGKIQVQCYDGGAARADPISTTLVNDGNWHHIAFNWNTANGGANSLYVDGALQQTKNSTAVWSINFTGTPRTFGDPVDTFWPSYVGEVAVFAEWQGRPLDNSELAALAKGFSPLLIAPDRLAFYAPLVRDPYNRAKDSFFSSQVGTTVSAHPRTLGGIT